jgi:hypothetical protein
VTDKVTGDEIQRLKKRFMKLDRDQSGSIDKDEFLQVEWTRLLLRGGWMRIEDIQSTQSDNQAPASPGKIRKEERDGLA